MLSILTTPTHQETERKCQGFTWLCQTQHLLSDTHVPALTLVYFIQVIFQAYTDNNILTVTNKSNVLSKLYPQIRKDCSSKGNGRTQGITDKGNTDRMGRNTEPSSAKLITQPPCLAALRADLQQSQTTVFQELLPNRLRAEQ